MGLSSGLPLILLFASSSFSHLLSTLHHPSFLLSTLHISSPKSKFIDDPAIKAMLDKYDLDGDGDFDGTELAQVITDLLTREAQIKKYFSILLPSSCPFIVRPSSRSFVLLSPPSFLIFFSLSFTFSSVTRKIPDLHAHLGGRDRYLARGEYWSHVRHATPHEAGRHDERQSVPHQHTGQFGGDQ
jgi:hypothetical protein